jgi:hypothetical protein
MSKIEMVFAFVFAQRFCSGIDHAEVDEEWIEEFAKDCYSRAILAVKTLELAAVRYQSDLPQDEN